MGRAAQGDEEAAARSVSPEERAGTCSFLFFLFFQRLSLARAVYKDADVYLLNKQPT